MVASLFCSVSDGKEMSKGKVPQQSKRARDFRRAMRKAMEHARAANESRRRRILEEYGPQGMACARKVR